MECDLERNPTSSKVLTPNEREATEIDNSYLRLDFLPSQSPYEPMTRTASTYEPIYPPIHQAPAVVRMEAPAFPQQQVTDHILEGLDLVKIIEDTLIQGETPDECLEKFLSAIPDDSNSVKAASPAATWGCGNSSSTSVSMAAPPADGSFAYMNESLTHQYQQSDFLLSSIPYLGSNFLIVSTSLMQQVLRVKVTFQRLRIIRRFRIMAAIMALTLTHISYNGLHRPSPPTGGNGATGATEQRVQRSQFEFKTSIIHSLLVLNDSRIVVHRDMRGASPTPALTARSSPPASWSERASTSTLRGKNGSGSPTLLPRGATEIDNSYLRLDFLHIPAAPSPSS